MRLFLFYRVCTIRSVDGSNITSYCVHECDASSRMGSRPRRFLITGHSNGCIQVRNYEINAEPLSDSSLCLNGFEIITKDISSQQELKPRHVRTFDFGLEDVLNKNQL